MNQALRRDDGITVERQAGDQTPVYTDLGHALARKRLAMLLPDLHGGGVQRVVLRLASGFSALGAEIDLVVCLGNGTLRDMLPPEVRLFELAASWSLGQRLGLIRIGLRSGVPAWSRLALERGRSATPLAHIGALADYLNSRRPDAVFAAEPYPSVQAIMARERSESPCRIVVSERTQFSLGKPKKAQRARRISAAMHAAYGRADGIIAVSHGVARDLAAAIDIDEDRMTVIHNPTLTPDFAERLAQPVSHSWFDNPNCKVAIAVGRLSSQKDYPTMLKALALARKQVDIRLLIVGEISNARSAMRRSQLEQLMNELGVSEHVEFLGYLSNPLPYMARADLFLLSSRFEGFPNVLLEALGAGVNIVSTRCPSGPDEILDNGRFGSLVPVEDPTAMAQAIVEDLRTPKPKEFLQARTKIYDFNESLRRYAEILLGARILRANGE